MRVDTIDLEFQGTRHVIASFLLHGPDGPVLIEPGPGSTLPTLLAGLERHGLGPDDVRDVLVTHIHLDHAGSAGWWAQRGARVWVHHRGARHLVDPSKLLASATRIYGDRMDTLWGDVLAAPADRVSALDDGDIVEAAGLRIRSIDTPGHARHHHVYCIDDIAFSGDAAGIQLPDNRWIDLPAPPPEFDVEAWRETLAKLRGLELRSLYRTHFGESSNVGEELDRFEEVLERPAGWVRDMLEQEMSRDDMVAEFTRRMRDWATETGANASDTLAYELANPRAMSVDGIARYWRKRSAT